MGKRAKVITIVAVCIVALGATAAIAGPMIYRDLIAAPADEIPTLTADEHALDPDAGTELDPAELAGAWVIAEGSEAGYRVDEVLNGTDVTVTGRTSQVSGSITVDGLSIAEASFEVDVASIATDSDSRDRYFRDNALNASSHPTATFVLTEPATLEAAPKSGEVVEHEFTGELTLAGVTRAVTFTAQARTDGSTAEITGQIPVAFADFGVVAPDLGFVKVEPTGYVEFSLVLERG